MILFNSAIFMNWQECIWNGNDDQIFLLGIPITRYSYSQIDSTLKEYFPLEIGNVWEYEEDIYPQ